MKSMLALLTLLTIVGPKGTPFSTDTYTLNITLSPADAAKMEALSRANLGERLTVRIGDETVLTPVVKTVVSDHIMLTTKP